MSTGRGARNTIHSGPQEIGTVLRDELLNEEHYEEEKTEHWDVEREAYFTDSSEEESDTPPTPNMIYAAWKAKARRLKSKARMNPGLVMVLECPYPFCEDFFDDKDALFDHYTTSHPLYIEKPGAKKPLQCPFCSTRYSPLQQRRMRAHQNQKHRSNRWAPKIVATEVVSDAGPGALDSMGVGSYDAVPGVEVKQEVEVQLEGKRAVDEAMV